MLQKGTAVPVNRALTRPELFAGAERGTAVIYGTICLVLAFSCSFKPPGIFFVPGLFIPLHLFFVWLAKKDPQMLIIYRKHLRYKQGYFPPTGTIKSPLPIVHPSVYPKKD